MTRPLAFVDVETTGLNPFVHQAYEAAWAIGDGDIRSCGLPHTLRNADPQALDIGGYWERGFQPNNHQHGWLERMRRDLIGVTLVGANPAFDAAFLHKVLGFAPWHHRLIDVQVYAQALFRWDEPPSLRDVVAHLIGVGFDIPEPDHTAHGDVATTRAVWHALRDPRQPVRRV